MGAAVGKGFAIGSACLVGLALFGAFITRIDKESVDILEPTQFAGLLIGAMLPYFFTALTMKAVGDTAYDMMNFIQADYDRGQEDKRQGIEYIPNYEGCIKISTEASLKKMIAPGILVIGTPLIGGFIFGPNATAGILAGNIVSGVQVAISQSNSGGAWDNAKKEVEAHRARSRDKAEKALVNLDEYRREFKVLEATRYTVLLEWMKPDMELKEKHVAAVVGDTVGDPLKDTSGPAINILVKLSAITSLIFGGYLENYHIFENKVAPSTAGASMLLRCNTAGENPDTTIAVMEFCSKKFMGGELGTQWNALPVIAKAAAKVTK